MVKRFLVTTADERTWPQDQPVLFLGEWCRLYNRKNAWKDLDAEVAPYHWDDRAKLYQDYRYLQKIYEILLQELSGQLNTIHSVEHSICYWRILIGPWLGYFVQMLFDRWMMIERAVSQNELEGVRILLAPPGLVVPNDMDEFQQLFVGDLWNQVIYGQLLRGYTNLAIEDLIFEDAAQNSYSKSDTANVKTSTLKGQLRRGLVWAASKVFKILVKPEEAFFISTYLPIKQDLQLQWHLGQFPKIWRSFSAPRIQFEESKRLWTFGRSSTEGFEHIVRAMIPKHIPIIYLEGYESLRKTVAKLPWPGKPSLIFTSNSYSSDDVVKGWVAEKVEAGARLVLGQHGGSYGVARWGFTEEHQLAVSNSWISWGWDVEGDPKIKPVGNLKMFGRASSWDPEGGVLMVEMAMPRYSYHMYSVPVGPQWLDYFEDQSSFVAALPDTIREKLLIRLHSPDYGWCQKQRWHELFPQIRLDDGLVPITELIKKSRLYVSTYNATTFLESLSMNIPTIMFWNPNHWELRDSAAPYFERLKKVGIFHETPESAAQHMALIWDNVTSWWNSEEVQTAREQFCYRYSRMPEQPLKDLELILGQRAQVAN
jgi:putative transferase (TIGR04331 family)